MKKIKRRCKCGCGKITNSGRMYINGHNKPRLGHKHSKETRNKMSLSHHKQYKKKRRRRCKCGCGTITNPGRRWINGHYWPGRKRTKENIKKNSLANLKFNPNDKYCNIWRDKEYRDDLRKNYCENMSCKGYSKRLCNHHIYLDKKRCAPNEIMTLYVSCHMILHHKLQKDCHKPANPKDYVIINRQDHVSYIHKKSRKITRIGKRISNG